MVITGIILPSTAFTPAKKKWKPLFNGKDLSGWDVFVGPKEKGGV
jgi:hypothetical protein